MTIVLRCDVMTLGKASDEGYHDAMIIVSWTTGANRDIVMYKVADLDVEMIRGLPGVLWWRSGKLQNRSTGCAGSKSEC